MAFRLLVPTVVANGLKAEIVLDAGELIGQISVEFMYESVNKETGLITPKVATMEQGKEIAKLLLEEWKTKA